MGLRMRSGNERGSGGGSRGEKKGRSLICWRARAKSGSVPLFRVVVGLGIGLVLLVTGVTMQERRAQELFRRRVVFDEYCFDHSMSSGAWQGNPYAEI